FDYYRRPTSVGKFVGNTYCSYRFLPSINPSVITECLNPSAHPSAKREAKFPPIFFSLCAKNTTISISPLNIFTNEYLCEKHFSHILYNHFSPSCNHFPTLPPLSLKRSTAAVGDRHHCRWRAPPLPLETTTSAMGDHHRCNARTPPLPWKNTTAAMGEHHHYHERTPLLPWENPTTAMGEHHRAWERTEVQPWEN
ncbi:hypothetical protein V8G54_006843, partial [Vigna mungo]